METKERIVVVGFGWVGQANALGLSLSGYDVSYFDVSVPQLHYADRYKDTYAKIPALGQLLQNDSERTTYLVCVGDRVPESGIQDISAIQKALEPLVDAKGTVVLRSTVLPASLQSLQFHFYVPEFLHEKLAVEECISPIYFIVGVRDKRAFPGFFDVWASAAHKKFIGTPEEASHIKYLSNIWNSVRIAFVNEFGSLMHEPSSTAQVEEINKVMDFFFEKKPYMRYGRSFGGHCLPKDTHALLTWAKSAGRNAALLEGTYRSNLIHTELERKYPFLPEWFSNWVRPQISGQAALRALGAAVVRTAKRPFTRA